MANIHPIFELALMPFAPKPATAQERKELYKRWNDQQEQYDSGLDDVEGRFHASEDEKQEND